MEVLKLLDTSGNCERPCILTCCILTLRIKQQCTESALTEAGHSCLRQANFTGRRIFWRLRVRTPHYWAFYAN